MTGTYLNDILPLRHFPEYGYGQVAPVYWKAGFKPLPMTSEGKKLAVRRATGHNGTVDQVKVANWCEEFYGNNIALRAEGWIAIDADHYDEKRGGDQLKDLETKFGALPPTVTSTSRGQASPSRQYFFRVPEGTRLTAKPAKDIEIVQFHHRYSVVAPSVHPKTGQPYVWYAADGEPHDQLFPSSLNEFAELPQLWLDGLAAGAPSPLSSTGPVEYNGDLTAFVRSRPAGDLPDRNRDTLDQYELDRYDGASTALWWLAGLAVTAPDTPGLRTAINEVFMAYMYSPTASERPAEERQRDLERSLAGALAKQEKFHDDMVAELAPVMTWVESHAHRTEVAQSFWESRPVLQHVKTTAHQSVLSPMALLGVLMQRATLSIPYYVGYHSALGTTSVNTLYAFVGATGGGKTRVQRIATDGFAMASDSWRPSVKEPGSGEGLVDAYRYWDKDSKSYQWVNLNHALMFGFDEVGALTARSGSARQGSTVFEVMKSAESGSSLSRVLARGNGSELPAGEYRFALFVNVQPLKAGELFEDAAVAGGLPGRFLWLPTQNRNARADYVASKVTKFTIPNPNFTGVEAIESLPVMDEAHLESQFAGHEEKRDELDSHAVLTRAKVAIALMALDGRVQLNEDDWELSGVIMKQSNETREEIQGAIKKAAAVENFSKGRAQGVRNVAARTVEDERGTKRLVDRIKGLKVKYPDESRSDIRRRIAARDRNEYFEEAWQIVEDETPASSGTPAV